MPYSIVNKLEIIEPVETKLFELGAPNEFIAPSWFYKEKQNMYKEKIALLEIEKKSLEKRLSIFNS